MKKIKPENIKVGDYIYLTDKGRGLFRCILKKNPNKKKELKYRVWFLKEKVEKTHLFEPKSCSSLSLIDETLKFYILQKLNKKEVLKFTKFLILENLK